MNKKVLITGAAGFIGSCLVEHMMKSTDFDVYAGIRGWATAARLSRLNPQFTQCDVLNEEELEAAVSKVDMIVHCAVGTKDVTVNGTKNVLKLAKKYDIEKVVYLSTVDVYGDVEGEVSEESELKYTGNPYNEMKIDAEKVCQNYIKDGLSVVMLRPGIVYGPYSTLWTERMALRIVSGKWGTFGKAGEGNCNLTYIYDLTQFIINSLRNEELKSEIFNIISSDRITWNEYFIKLSEKINSKQLNNYGKNYKFKTKIFTPIRNIAKYLMKKHLKRILNLYKRSDLSKNLMKIGEKSIKSTPTLDEYNLYGRKVIYQNGNSIKHFPQFSYLEFNRGLDYSVDWLEVYGIYKRQ